MYLIFFVEWNKKNDKGPQYLVKKKAIKKAKKKSH
jgi:hypothetical protein